MSDYGCMASRCLQKIVQTPEHQRFSVLGEGLELLADNVATLDEDVSTLGESRRDRGAAVLRCFADEEAAKILILLDLARAGWTDDAVVKKCVKNFYTHLARCLYVRAYSGAPADLAEVRDYVDQLRQEHYLDGPMEVDWIFDNEVLTSREGRLYVDYVQDEGGGLRWAGPAEQAAMYDEPFDHPSPSSVVVQLVAAMRHIGLLTEDGLAAIRAVWDNVAVDDTLHWMELRPLNLEVVERLAVNRRYVDEGHAAVRFVVDHWLFPMTNLNLTMVKVSVADLKRKQERWLANQMGVDVENDSVDYHM